MLIKALYSVREVADMLGLELEKVRRMVEAGHLDAEKIGGQLFVPLATLQARPAIWESIVLRKTYEAEAE